MIIKKYVGKPLLGLDHTPKQPAMTLQEGIATMLEGRPGPDKKTKPTDVSVLNPQLTVQQAWDIVWTRITEMRNDPQCEFKAVALLPDWLIKRIRQVTTNKMNPDLEIVADSILDPAHEKPSDPFEREFS